MTFKELKNLAKKVVDESNYSDFAKAQMFSFIEETSDPTNVKALVLDEQVQDVSSDPDAKAVVDARFKAMVSESQQMLQDSDDFLRIGRRVICNYLESNTADYENYLDMASFIMYEASDYQILTTLMEDYVPEETYNDDYAPVLVESFTELTGLPIVLEAGGLKSAKDIAMKKIPAIQTKAAGGLKSAKDIAMKKIPAIQTRAALKKFRGKPGKRAVAHISRGAGKVGEKSKYLAKKTQVLGKKGTKLLKKHRLAGALAIASVVALAAYKLYKRFTDQARRACAGSADKTACMAQYRVKAIKAQIAKLKAGMGECNNSSNPAKCKETIQNRIAKLQNKI